MYVIHNLSVSLLPDPGIQPGLAGCETSDLSLSLSATPDSLLTAADGETITPAKAEKDFATGAAGDVWWPRTQHIFCQHNADQIQVRLRLRPDATLPPRGGGGWGGPKIRISDAGNDSDLWWVSDPSDHHPPHVESP